ncbi:DNA polymerase I [Pseudalkalibacillus hwajinpoensis]|uniref:DNA polymerase I n=1 Tax=Guptibacillus hwajinpoensis TaxID=208199 RepID=A0A4U1MCT5_9BACL|nr:DNA polymerase I [Pseudalkalibacillus hwajinpoensis]TKD67896.1 DNA polymerase I [Pseudalkalibacillus hwajinpoensis]
MKNKLVLIDGNSIAYRAFFALPLLNNDKGVYTNAVLGFTTMLLKIIENESPTHMLVAFDAGKTTFRHKTYTEYKGGRQKTPSELSEQFPVIREVLDVFDIKRYEIKDYEADDIIGTVSLLADKEDWDVKIYSGDKDLLQLVSKNVHVALTRKGITDIDTYDPAFLNEKYGLTPDQIIDMKALMGDNSDNIPGVPGVGEKTALKLLKQFGTVEAVYESLDEVSGKKLKEKLEENQDKAMMSKELVTIFKETPLDLEIKDLAYSGFERDAVAALFSDLGFKSLLNRIGAEEVEGETEIDELAFETLEQIEEHHLVSPSAMIVEVMEENYHNAEIQGFSIINENGNFYLPTDLAMSSDLFKTFLEDQSQKKWVFDAKRAVVALGWKGIALKGITFDLVIASYLLNPSESTHDLSAISRREGFSIVSSDETVYGKGAKRKQPEENELADHLVRKAYAVYQLKETLEEQLRKNEQFELFQDLEMPLTLVLGEMETKGVSVDTKFLEKMGEELNKKLTAIEARIFELAGTEFNINSPKQLGEVLFDKLELPVVKKTKTGYSTSADVLEKLESKHEVIPEILLYRQLGKLNSTYVEGLLKVIYSDTGKIHTRFNQALTQTGRLSSTDPNLQNIPIRLEEGRKIRKAFVPSTSNWVMFAADYSQIELRVLAHIAKDENLIEAFQNGEDIHTKTAMNVFDVEKDDVTSDMRRHAKAVNFGIVYGISDYGLSQSIGISRKEAGEFIDRYLESFPGVKRYMEDVVSEAKQDGFVSTLMQRRRYLPEINSRNFNQRGFAERTAMNTPIQGTAADIIKLAMVQMDTRLKEENLQARMLLQVHDELIFEAPEEEIETLKRIVPEVMESAIKLDVPLKVDYEYGSTWYDAK